MQEKIRQASRRIGLILSILCFLVITLAAAGEGVLTVWHVGVIIGLALLVYAAFQLLGWIINLFISPRH